MISERLQKVINMAKFGIGNEKAVAERLVKRECEKLGLDYKDVMSGKTMRGGDHGPFGNYKDFYSRSAWSHNNQANYDDINDLFRKAQSKYNAAYQEQMEAQELRRKEAERRSRTAIDRLGGSWTFIEIMKLSKEKRHHLFGKDPIVGDW